ncbi:shikimate kinase [Gordonia araii NBRC 100433]|uniref:Shikimate kinase n=1 Tax=Gordonia araii NBRC 100433 TaxID=1073574 RepID=G7H5E3_9ACTN|nr:shikimate kinase [Gordonia araii]NNG95782.1 shikimate kinase [Gordonia araii NBRC 100433]GAB11068.1 shikimate kinase [Gordonia araii NBRC 100433]
MSARTAPAVVLTGFMGAGKSTVGRAVAERLGVRFLDTDAELERSTGRTIASIFTEDGEAAFRELELATVTRVLADFDGVVALGGGSVTVPAIRAALTGGPVVHLRITAENGFRRVEGSDRPLLAGPEPRDTYAQLLAERAELYETVAAVTVDADQPVDTVVDAILTALRKDNES